MSPMSGKQMENIKTSESDMKDTESSFNRPPKGFDQNKKNGISMSKEHRFLIRQNLQNWGMGVRESE